MEKKVLREIIDVQKFVLTIELDPPKGVNLDNIIADAIMLSDIADAVNLADSPMANMRMSPITLSYLVKQKTPLDTIFHLTCRDRNIIGLQSELLGAAALGINNILTLTGDSPERGDHPQAKGVFEINSSGLIKLAANLNRGEDMMGNKLDMGTNFFIGTTANPASKDLSLEYERLIEKIELGANFAQTQPIYDIAQLEKFINKIDDLNFPVLVGLLPLKSYKMAKYLSDHVPGIEVPERILNEMEKGGREAGVKIAAELLSAMRSLTRGAHLMPVGDAKLVLDIIEKEQQQ